MDLWTQRADLAQLVAVLGADNVRWVGGAVRDTLLNDEVRDIDAATPLLPDEVMERLMAAGIRVVPTGIDHGTITALLDDGPVEITTLRHDVSTDGRRATVAFARDWRDDAARRDFTINALYAHPETLEISDYFGGLGDLAARRIRFIGDARERIREDHLRILRYYRFQARFGSELDDEAEQACADLAHTLKGLSRERVATELLSLLGLPDPYATVLRMRERGVLPVILPEAGRAELARLELLVGIEAQYGAETDPLRRLAALLPAVPAIAENVAARLRLSRAQRDRLTSLAARSPADGEAPLALAYREGTENARDRLLLTNQDPRPVIEWPIPQFPLKGGEIVARGVGAGPEVARLLRQVESRWIDEGFPGRERVEELLAEQLRGAPTPPN
ncbi:CCA tRNA nucleotidyltransferase [Erythrobacter sp. SDW2]|uniref:CCA tRNA nucleotidyltransferase n=1 Tax=Erythrobacter sp. SDW2 TaxID=2907154 RepID=UPI001F396790|nr:CCA tRNA nucleotidyltransferase [Erythrobacter sp. SDW2]UIP06401.1 CCA tRNA nucleotidyltransferase [Erythrobacter sp. SDW2]